MSTDYRPRSTRKAEDAFICRLLDSDKLYSFACTLLFKTIQKCKEVGLSNQHIQAILGRNIATTTFSKLLLKPGLNCSEGQCKELLTKTTFEAFLSYCKSQQISFTSIMGAFYDFEDDNQLALRCLESDKALQTQFMKKCQDYFSIPPSLSFQELKRMIGHTKGKWFYLFVMSYMNSKVNSIFRHNLQYEANYVRKKTGVRIKRTMKRSNVNSIPLSQVVPCKKEQFKSYTFKNVVRSPTFYRVPRDGIWARFMKRFKKQIIAGPSSSSGLAYQLVFQITKLVPPTEYNKTMLLLCILADYYHFYHSISEVLQEYSAEAGFPEYRLNVDDLQYIQTQVKKADIDLR